MTGDLLFDLGTWVLVLASLPVLTFVPMYLRPRSRWRSTRGGRATLYQAVALAAVIVLLMVTNFAGVDFAGRAIARLVVYGLLLAASSHMLYTLVRIQVSGPEWALRPTRLRRRH